MIAFNGQFDVPGLKHVLVLRDDQPNSSLYYCASLRPRIARRGDGGYHFALVRYRDPDQGEYGRLVLTVDLALTADEESQIEQALLKRNKVKPTLEPIPWTSGTVTYALNGQMMNAPARASLIGRNSVLVELNLDSEVIGLVESLNQGASPLEVVYKLAYEVIQPVSSWTATIDWTRFEEFVQKKWGVNLFFLKISSVETVQKLEEAKVVTIKAEQYGVDSVLTEAIRRLFLASLGMLFTPLPRLKAPGPGDGPGDGEEGDVAFSYSELKQIAQSNRHGEMKSEVEEAVSRPVFIQSVLTDLAEAYKKEGTEDFVLGGDMPVFPKLQVACHAEFEADQIDDIAVFFRRTPTASDREIRFNKSGPLKQPVQLSYSQGSGDSERYDWSYQVSFKGGTPRPLRSPITPLDRKARFIDIIPRDLYTRRAISVDVVTAFPWEVVKQVLVDLRWNKDDPQPLEVFSLTQKEPSATWNLFRPTTDPARFVVQISYESKAYQRVVTNWIERNKSIRCNPVVHNYPVSASGVDWSRVALISLDVNLAAPAGNDVLPQKWRILLSAADAATPAAGFGAREDRAHPPRGPSASDQAAVSHVRLEEAPADLQGHILRLGWRGPVEASRAAAVGLDRPGLSPPNLTPVVETRSCFF